MKILTFEQINSLKEYESYLHSALYAHYKRNTTRRENDFIADVLESVTGEKVTRNWSCAKCTYDVWLKLAKLYYRSIEELDADDAETTDTVQDDAETTDTVQDDAETTDTVQTDVEATDVVQDDAETAVAVQEETEPEADNQEVKPKRSRTRKKKDK